MYITKAAIKYPNGEIVTSNRHYKIIALQAKLGILSKGDCVQGFVDETGRFLTRKEALKVAIASGQVQETQSTILYSEDLWPNDAVIAE